MDLNKVFVIGLAILAIFVIGDAILVILTPPKGDELQAYAFIIIGIFMLFIGYDIAKRDRNCPY